MSEKGLAWGLVGESVKQNNTVENLARLFTAAKDWNYGVFISPHYLYPHDRAWQFGGILEHMMLDEKEALPLMSEGGAIVLNGSMVSVKGLPGFSVYAATKAALRSFARTWAVDLRGKNIRVNVVSPGTVVTPAYKSELGMNDQQIEAFVAQAAMQPPLGRRARRTRSPGLSCRVPRLRRQQLHDQSGVVRGRRSRPDLATMDPLFYHGVNVMSRITTADGTRRIKLRLSDWRMLCPECGCSIAGTRNATEGNAMEGVPYTLASLWDRRKRIRLQDNGLGHPECDKSV